MKQAGVKAVSATPVRRKVECLSADFFFIDFPFNIVLPAMEGQMGESHG